MKASSASEKIAAADALYPAADNPGKSVAYLDIRNNGTSAAAWSQRVRAWAVTSGSRPDGVHGGKDVILKLTFAHAGTITVVALATDTGG